MSSITDLIKELRDKTGAGFLDCKKTLEENNNDIENSIEALRKKGLAKASKKSDRAANEGAVGVYSNKDITVLIKVNSETDFAAKSETFLDFLDNLGALVLENNTIIDKNNLLNLKYEDGTIKDYFDSMIAKIGENLILSDLLIKENKDSHYSYYIHNSYRGNIGKIVSLLEFTSTNKEQEIEILSKNLCMHIAAMKPESLDIEDLDKNLVEREEKIQRELILRSGKPSNIIDNYGIDVSTINKISNEIKNVYKKKYQICLIIGGGNIFRGIKGASEGIDRSTSDYMGMLATVMNALSLQSSLEKIGVPTRVQSAITMSQIAEPYIRRRALRHLERNRIVIFAAGTGNPFFSTDTAATLRASELDCELIIKATKVNGIYNKDPIKHKNAKLIKNISYNEVINQNLQVMDLTAISLAKDTKIPIFITNIFNKNSLINVLNRRGSYSKIS